MSSKKTREIMQKLMILEGSQPLIGEVELFVETKEGPVLFTPYIEYIKDEKEQEAIIPY